jgi:hypothetical protein
MKQDIDDPAHQRNEHHHPDVDGLPLSDAVSDRRIKGGRIADRVEEQQDRPREWHSRDEGELATREAHGWSSRRWACLHPRALHPPLHQGYPLKSNPEIRFPALER